MIKRGIGMLLAVVLLYAPLPLRAAQTLTIDSTYGYAVDLHTLQVLYEKESDQRMYPASMTKVLTAGTNTMMIPDSSTPVETVSCPAICSETFSISW